MTPAAVGRGERVSYVPQREAWDCGVASLAMAAGVSYEEALAVVPEGQRGDLLHTVHFTQWLGALGCAVRKTYGEHDDLRGIRLLCHNGHFVVRRPDGKVNDPARGEGREPYFYRNPFDVWEVHRLAALPPDAGGEDGARLDAVDRLKLCIGPCGDAECAAEGRVHVAAPSGAGHCSVSVREGIDAALGMNPAHFDAARRSATERSGGGTA